MRLITFTRHGAARPGALLPSGAVADLASAPFEPTFGVRSVAELLGRGPDTLHPLAEWLADVDGEGEQGWLVAGDDITFLPPLGANVLVVAAGGNYHSHLREMGAPPHAEPSAYLVSPHSLIGSGAAIHLPTEYPDMVDWEGEFCLVVGRPCHRVDPRRARDCIAGYTIFNDVSARDWVAATRSTVPAEAVAAWRKNLLFKQFPTFGPIGPAVVTVDDVGDPHELELTTRLNGQTVQRDRVGSVQFGPEELLSRLSRVYSFQPGDVVTLGTPAGVGFAREPQVFLRDGDEVTVTVDRVGCLRNTVARAVPERDGASSRSLYV